MSLPESAGPVEQANGLIGRLVQVTYLDHVMFRNVRSIPEGHCAREIVGWIAKETPEDLYILSDRSTKKLPQENTEDRFTGMVIVKRLILEVREIA